MAIITTELVITNSPALLSRVHNNTVPKINRISKDVSGATIPQITLDITQKVLSIGKSFISIYHTKLTSVCLRMDLVRELGLDRDIWFTVLQCIFPKFKLSHPNFEILSYYQSNDCSFFSPFWQRSHDDGQIKHQMELLF